MLKRLIPAVLVLAAITVSAPSAFAAKNENRPKGEKRSTRMLSRFDTNHDGSIDSTEAVRVRNAYEALKALDTNKDGQLSDSEITAMKVAPRNGVRTGKPRKKNI
ncbi:hypothetical protein ACXR0O_19360 [Verrucomicrobiota bacterium sgz303538]